MKKLCLGLATLVGLISATIGFAASAVNKESGYFSTQHPLVSPTKAVKATLFPPTDITVTNASSNAIYVVVPNTPIYDLLYSNSQPDHIRNNGGAFYTNIALLDPNRNTFWNYTVCPRALVTVYGYPGSYKVNVDNEYCN